MYWGQVATALAVGVGVAYGLASIGRPPIVLLAGAVITYSVVRWLIAWVYRIRYWHARGTNNEHRQECPHCHAQRHRIGGDWILQCKKCGWKAGLPILRWFTQSVPARQLRRTVAGPKLVIVVIAVALIATGGIGTISVPTDLAAGPNAGTGSQDITTPTSEDSSKESVSTPSPTEELRGTPPTETPESQESNLAKAEQLILEWTNEVRVNHEQNELSRDQCLDEYARKHSRDMAEYGYSIRHGGPNGESWEERASKIQDECGGAVSENIHSGPVDVETYIYGTSETIRLSSASNLAEYAVRGWMNSPGHRENMLDSQWDEVGIGVATDGEDIYFTILFS
jgi:uncharacterized protein YkwD/ribosomal protein L37AE/L43A